MLLSVTRHDLDFNNIMGAIPSELGMLSSLTSLQLDFNDITGKIPTERGMLLSSTVLDLNFNDITGAIPSELGILLIIINLTLIIRSRYQCNVAHCPRRIFGKTNVKYLASALVAITLLALLVIKLHVMSCNLF